MRKYVGFKTVRFINFAIFNSFLSYCSLSGFRIVALFMRFFILQKNAVWTNFQPRNPHASPLLKKINLKISRQNLLRKHFVSKSLNNLSQSIFYAWFGFSSDNVTLKPQDLHRVTSWNLFYKTNRYGKYSIAVNAVELWNKIQKQI